MSSAKKVKATYGRCRTCGGRDQAKKSHNNKELSFHAHEVVLMEEGFRGKDFRVKLNSE